MKDNDYLQLKHFTNHKGIGLIPATDNSREWLECLKNNEPVNFKIIESRDVKLHKAYFKMLAYIYDRLQPSFKAKIKKEQFYKFLKILGKEYDLIYSFADGRQFIEYHSISFSKMNNAKFKEFFNTQLSTIYEELLIPMEQDYLMDEINVEFERVLDKLL